MFMFRVSVDIEQLGAFRPDILVACLKALERCERDMHFIRVDREAFGAFPEDSIDYAVMEKSDRAAMALLDGRLE